MILWDGKIHCDFEVCDKFQRCKSKYDYLAPECDYKREIILNKILRGTCMKILSMNIRNFKNIRELVLMMNCLNMNIFGANEAGKTTVFDAFCWLLFDKDSLNQTNFDIKPIDHATEQVIHNLNTEVVAVLSNDSGSHEFKKVFYEKWEKKRGSASPEFTGHTTDYFLDGVPVKKAEYTAKIGELVDESVFKLLSNPLYFNEMLHWKERRELLLKVCGSVTMDEVFSADKTLDSLREMLSKYSLECYRKLINSKRKEINDQLQKIPLRIDERQKSIPDVTGIDFPGIENQIKGLTEKKDEYYSEVYRIKNGTEITQKQKLLAEADTALINLKNAHEQKKAGAVKDSREAAANATNEYDSRKRAFTNAKNELSDMERVLSTLQKGTEELYDQWYKVNDEKFTPPEQACVCPTCGQEIPQWKLAEAVEKAEKAFNLDKSQRLDKITEKGKALSDEKAAKQTEIDELKASIEELEKGLVIAKGAMDAANKAFNEINSTFPDVTTTKDYQDKLSEKQKINDDIASLKNSSAVEVNRINNLINETENSIRDLQKELLKKDQIQDAKDRIKELEAEEKRLAKEYEALEKELFLTEQYEKTEVNLLESKINGKFREARFKLFNQNINGGIEPCCEVLYKGVPYASMNHAARTQIGLDIIQTLSEFYNFNAPIWIDNREGITHIPYMDSQIISLYVSPEDKALRTEAA
jgi:chromosome segregation ATPase